VPQSIMAIADRVTDRAFLKWDICTLDMLRCTEVSQPTDGMGQSGHFRRGFGLPLLPRKRPNC